jgi:hypothetical protein
MINSFRKLDVEFIPYRFAHRMKQIGFTEFCFGEHKFEHVEIEFHHTRNSDKMNGNTCSAILWQQAFSWFDNKFGYKVDCWNEMNKENILSYLIDRVEKKLQEDGEVY